MSEVSRDTAAGRPLFKADRTKAFVDAVVAIAMTLLILPLMEGVSDAAANDDSAAQWFSEHWPQLLSFVLSFAIIAMFWLSHNRMFAGVERVSIALLWLVMLWLLSIVWLPVATALSGQLSSRDELVKVVYIGSMIFTSVVSLVIRLFLRRHRELHDIDDQHLRQGMAADIAMIVLFALALIISLLVPGVSYYALFLMFLVGPVQALFARMLGATNPERISGRGR